MRRRPGSERAPLFRRPPRRCGFVYNPWPPNPPRHVNAVRPILGLLAATLVALGAPVLAGNPQAVNGYSARADAQVERALDTLRRSGIDAARAEVDAILARSPNRSPASGVRL